MSAAAQVPLLPAEKVAAEITTHQSPNGIRYGAFGETHLPQAELERVVQTVPHAVAAALTSRAYYFVPLTIGETDETLIAAGYNLDLSDRAVCHRVLKSETSECTFISTRLMQDRFALAFEFFINVGHQFVEAAGVPDSFNELAWSQALADVRGETSQDAWESRRRALEKAGDSSSADAAGKSAFRTIKRNAARLGAGTFPSENSAPRKSESADPAPEDPAPQNTAPQNAEANIAKTGGDLKLQRFVDQEQADADLPTNPNHLPGTQHDSPAIEPPAPVAAPAVPVIDERARSSFFESAFADAIAIYMLSLMLDFDYFDLREREYPLLAAPALAERLRHVATLFPANPGYEFQISYRRRA